MLYRSYLCAAGDVFIRRRYRHERLTVPTLLVFGTEDFYVPTSYIAGWQAHAPGMRVEFVPGCGHFLPEERPTWYRPTFANSCPDRCECAAPRFRISRFLVCHGQARPGRGREAGTSVR